MPVTTTPLTRRQFPGRCALGEAMVAPFEGRRVPTRPLTSTDGRLGRGLALLTLGDTGFPRER